MSRKRGNSLDETRPLLWNRDRASLVVTPHHFEAHHHVSTSTEREVAFNFTNSILGAGIVNLPSALQHSGIVYGLLMMTITAYVTNYTVNLLIKCAKKVHVRNYEDLCRYCFGEYGYWSVSVSMFLFDLGASLVYLLVLGDSAVPIMYILFGWQGDYYRKGAILFFALIVIFPLLTFKDVSKIEKTSALSVFAVLFVLFAIVYRFSESPTGIIDIEYELFAPHPLTSLGAFAFAFVCHDSAFLMYNTLQDATISRWTRLTNVVMSSCLLICCLFAVTGYLTFGNHCEANILKNYKHDDMLIFIAQMVYMVTMCLTFPLAFFVMRHVIYAAIQRKESRYVSVIDASNTAFYGITIPLFTVLVSLTLVIDDLGLVMSITGSIAAVILAFMLPCLCHLKLSEYDILFWRNKGKEWEAFYSIVPPILTLALGTTAGVIATLSTLHMKFS